MQEVANSSHAVCLLTIFFTKTFIWITSTSEASYSNRNIYPYLGATLSVMGHVPLEGVGFGSYRTKRLTASVHSRLFITWGFADRVAW
jgi:hypothetical protein